MNYFKEEQYFRQPWLWLVILFFPSFSIYGLFKQLMFGIPVGDNPISNEGVISFSVLIGLGLPILFWFMNLKIRELIALKVTSRDGKAWMLIKFKCNTTNNKCKVLTLN